MVAFLIELKDFDERYSVLTITNTGKALPEHLDIINPSTLGLKLVFPLVSQIEGTLKVERGPQPVFSIRLPVHRTRA